MNYGGLFSLPIWQIFFLLLVTILSCEFIVKSNLTKLLKAVFKLLDKALKLLKSTNISDEKKETLILLYSRRLLYYSAIFFWKLILVFFPILFSCWTFFGNWNQMISFLVQLDVIIAITFTSFIYIFFRSR